ncbi:MAG: hypothetical protein QM705_11960 [Ancrocorticia sp.]
MTNKANMGDLEPSAVTSLIPSIPQHALVRHNQDGSPRQTVIIPCLGENLIQPMPDDGFLVAFPRSYLKNGEYEYNALLIDSSGKVVHTGAIGDAIAHLMTDSVGNIWVGYYDEGVFGRSIASAGIIKWSPRLEPIWEFDQSGDYQIDDCYTLNVTDDTVTACPYRSFPILAINNGQARIHPTQGPSGPHGLLVHNETAAIIGAYGNYGSMWIGPLIEFTDPVEWHLLLPDGSTPSERPICRGSKSNLFVQDQWFIFDLTDIASPQGT